MENREDRIRAKAHALWEAAGHPTDRGESHYRMEAERLVDAEEREKAFQKRRRPAIDIAPSGGGNSLGDIQPAMPDDKRF